MPKQALVRGQRIVSPRIVKPEDCNLYQRIRCEGQPLRTSWPDGDSIERMICARDWQLDYDSLTQLPFH
jgi:hypothetical protein